MNQRASHFQFGKSSQNYSSVYGKDYTPKEALQNQIQVTNPFRGSSLKHDAKGSFTTTNKILLRAWDNSERIKLSDDKLKELKSSHFKLGSYNPQEAMTTNKIYHDRKNISSQASKNQEESKNKMRGHNHDFKEQNHTNYRSAYANQFTPKEGQPVVPAITTATENAICFGSQALPMVTTSGASFTPKQAIRANFKPQPSLGVKLGGPSEPMETMNQLYYTQKEINKASLPQSTMKQLRSTHFNLGQAPLSYNTESHNYRSTPGRTQDGQLKYHIPTYEAGTWDNKNAKFTATTTNQRQLPQRQVKPYQKAVQAARDGIQFGGHTGFYTSEFKSNYGAPSKMVPNSLQINKKSNVVIGQGKSHWITQNRANYKTNDLKEGKYNVDIKKLNTEDHFHIGGNSVEPKVTVYQDEYRPDLQNRNKTFHRENK